MEFNQETKTLVLSKRNIKSLITKLDGFPENSSLTIIKKNIILHADEKNSGGGWNGSCWVFSIARENLNKLLHGEDVNFNDIQVVLEEDAEHYQGRIAGIMHPDTEAKL